VKSANRYSHPCWQSKIQLNPVKIMRSKKSRPKILGQILVAIISADSMITAPLIVFNNGMNQRPGELIINIDVTIQRGRSSRTKDSNTPQKKWATINLPQE